MICEKYTEEITQFRQKLYQNFNNRADTMMDLVDAMSSYADAKSVVEYSLASCFRRSYSMISKGIAKLHWGEMDLAKIMADHIPSPQARKYHLLAVDVTPQPRPYAHTLADRGMVYQPNTVVGNKPVTIGHDYSTVAYVPEAEEGVTSSWVVPLTTKRVKTTDDKELLGADQIGELLADNQLPFGQMLTVEVADTKYSKPAYLHRNRQYANLVTIVRSRSNRTYYREPTSDQQPESRGHPAWYGEPFSLKDEGSWHAPDDSVTLYEQSRRGKKYRVEIQVWHNMRMRGKQKPYAIPMHLYPFTLIRIRRYHENGDPACQNALWLLVVGQRRQEISALSAYNAYKHRYDVEHFFRFGKQQLLLDAFQTPEVDREESWWQLVHIAYAQLWLARHLAISLPRPWERNLPAYKQQLSSPTSVRRDFARIIQQIGTPAKPPKRRGISSGRPKGTKLTPRSKKKVVIKGQKKEKPP